MLSNENLKLGKGLFSWSIPALITCPGSTPPCISVCYALKRRFKKGPVLDAHLRNLDLSLQPDFSKLMRAEINRQLVRLMRIHVAGDFYDEEYVDKWLDICRKTPDTRYFFYTRSWRLPAMYSQLKTLAKLPNVQGWWSMDLATGKPPRDRGIGIAYMAISDADVARAPAYAQLVFRDNPQTVLKKVNGVQVCPTEIGVKQTHERVTCTKCKLCWHQESPLFQLTPVPR